MRIIFLYRIVLIDRLKIISILTTIILDFQDCNHPLEVVVVEVAKKENIGKSHSKVPNCKQNVLRMWI